jgi:hypothetical protein
MFLLKYFSSVREGIISSSTYIISNCIIYFITITLQILDFLKGESNARVCMYVCTYVRIYVGHQLVSLHFDDIVIICNRRDTKNTEGRISMRIYVTQKSTVC